MRDEDPLLWKNNRMFIFLIFANANVFHIYIYIFKKSEYFSTLVVKTITKKKGGEDQDTKTSLIDDVYLQVCHVKKN